MVGEAVLLYAQEDICLKNQVGPNERYQKIDNIIKCSTGHCAQSNAIHHSPIIIFESRDDVDEARPQSF